MFELKLAEKPIQKHIQSLIPEPYHVEIYQWGFDNSLLVKFFIYHQFIGKVVVKDFNDIQEKVNIFLNL
jgi:hypothetical protein